MPDAPEPLLTPQAAFARAAWPWALAATVVVVLIYLLAPVLTPFLVGIMLAYVGNPLVDRLCRWRVPRALAAVLVLAAAWLLIIVMVLMLIPLIRDEIALLAERLPQAIPKANAVIAPWVERLLGVPLSLDAETLQNALRENKDIVRNIIQRVFDSMRLGGLALVGIMVNLLLAPVVTFYFLLDWHALIRRIDTLIPRTHHARVGTMAREIDGVLAAYLRGQLLVMGILAGYYAIALSIAGLPSALAIGLLTGLLIFIPYVGFATSFLLALVVALLQFNGWPPILWVIGIYGLGQILESFILTPYLVGEKVGLPPLAVIFALMAFGQLFGFFGVLLALPASAVILVGLRELHRSYLESRLYRGA